MPHLASNPSMRAKSVASDDYTLYSDADSVCSDISSTDSLVSYFTHDELPAFRLPREDAHNKDVYEAWTIYLSADYKATVSARKICGITVVEDFDSYQGTMSTISELYDQKDLREMHFKALDKYQAKHTRSWPSRIVRGKSPSYEEDIDSRMRKLPDAVQSEISNLLADREESSSNRFHNRVWTVVMMQEQLHRRFANADPTVVPKRHKVRFWKNPGKNQRSEYLLIIRGGEGRRVTEEKGQSEFKRFENPWRKADDAELHKKASQQRARRRERIKDRDDAKATPPSYRYRAPPGPPSPGSNPPSQASYHSYPPPAPIVPPPLRSYAAPPPPPHPMPGSLYFPPPPAPTPPASYPTPPAVRCAQSISHGPPPLPSLSVPPTLRPGSMHELPPNSQQPQFWNPRGGPYSCCGSTARYKPPIPQFYPTSNLQAHRPYQQAIPPAQPALHIGASGPPPVYPRPQPFGTAPMQGAPPTSVSSASSSASSVSSANADISTDRKCRFDDYDTEDEESVIDDEASSNSVDGTSKDGVVAESK